MNRAVREECVNVQGVCVCMCVIGQLDLTGILGAHGSGFPGQRSPPIDTGTPKVSTAMAQKPHHLQGGSSGSQECSHTTIQIGIGHLPGYSQ